jgi:hypothetical protein
MFSWRRQAVVTEADSAAPPSLAVRLVEQQLAQERASLSAASSGAPLCRTVPGSPVKYYEGAAVALARLRSALLADPTQSAEGCAQRILEAWRHEHENRKGIDWASYTDGGDRALTEALQMVASTTAEVSPPRGSRPVE